MAAKKLTTRPGGIELRDGLPRYPEQYVRFIIERLPDYQPCSIPRFMKHIGFIARPGGSPGKIYGKMLAAFQEALDEGLVSQNGTHGWRVAERQAKAS